MPAFFCLLLLTFFFHGNVFAKEIRGKPIVIGSKQSTNVSNVPRSVPVLKAETDYTTVGFDKLSNFTFAVPEGIQPTNATANTNSATQIPADVKAFDQKKVALKGFMLPLKVDDGVVTEMLIMKDQSMCCYGAVPRINDWVSVKMKKGGVKSIMDQPVTLYGKLHVGEMLENGYLVGIYELDGEKMDEPKD
ncbi:MAG: DUF3299 domain-containing protein [Verrucomicrobiota bacterium]